MEGVSEPTLDVINSLWAALRSFFGVLQLILRPVGIVLYHGLYFLLIAILVVLKLLWAPISFLLLPFVFLGRFLLAAFVAPFHFLARFETLYIYLGIAAIVGVVVCLAVAQVYRRLYDMLQLGAQSKPERPPRSVKQFREQRKKKRFEAEAQLFPPSGYANLSDGLSQTRNSRPLITPTIMEEMDSDY